MANATRTHIFNFNTAQAAIHNAVSRTLLTTIKTVAANLGLVRSGTKDVLASRVVNHIIQVALTAPQNLRATLVRVCQLLRQDPRMSSTRELDDPWINAITTALTSTQPAAPPPPVRPPAPPTAARPPAQTVTRPYAPGTRLAAPPPTPVLLARATLYTARPAPAPAPPRTVTPSSSLITPWGRIETAAIRWRLAPFFDLGRIVTITVMGSGYQATSRVTFTIPAEDLRMIAGDQTFRIVLLTAHVSAAFLSTKTIGGRRCSALLEPRTINHAMVNGRIVNQVRNRGMPRKKPAAAHPIDITGAINTNATQQLLEMHSSQHCNDQDVVPPSPLVVAIAVVRKAPLANVMEFAKRNRLSEADRVASLRRAAEQADDDDLVASAAVVSLKDPAAFTRITTPARSRSCEHPECFDLEMFLAMNEQTPVYACPVCDRAVGSTDALTAAHIDAPPPSLVEHLGATPLKYLVGFDVLDDLVVDEHFERMLRAAGDRVDSMTLEVATGEWRMPEGHAAPVEVNLDGGDDDEDGHRDVKPKLVDLADARPASSLSASGGRAGSSIPVISLLSDSEDEDDGNAAGDDEDRRAGTPAPNGEDHHDARPCPTPRQGETASPPPPRPPPPPQRASSSNVIDLTGDSDDDDGARHAPPPRPAAVEPVRLAAWSPVAVSSPVVPAAAPSPPPLIVAAPSSSLLQAAAPAVPNGTHVAQSALVPSQPLAPTATAAALSPAPPVQPAAIPAPPARAANGIAAAAPVPPRPPASPSSSNASPSAPAPVAASMVRISQAPYAMVFTPPHMRSTTPSPPVIPAKRGAPVEGGAEQQLASKVARVDDQARAE
ncbi:SUMO ligase siz1 [Allomyces arbusculus]|nr:SUMO ligase siz1 [Allomyces arbusculus]